MEQYTLDWYRSRLGKITGSQVGIIISDNLNKTAERYLYQLAAERSMNQNIVNDDDLFRLYLDQISITSKAMRWGSEQEEFAREYYEKETGYSVAEVGLINHHAIDNYATSPDGLIIDEHGSVEIKCPSQAVFMLYKDQIKCNKTLLAVEPKYYYQCQSHMACTGAKWCDFIVYNPFQDNPMHTVRITPDYAAFDKIERRVIYCNNFINQLIK